MWCSEKPGPSFSGLPVLFFPKRIRGKIRNGQICWCHNVLIETLTINYNHIYIYYNHIYIYTYIYIQNIIYIYMYQSNPNVCCLFPHIPHGIVCCKSGYGCNIVMTKLCRFLGQKKKNQLVEDWTSRS